MSKTRESFYDRLNAVGHKNKLMKPVYRTQIRGDGVVVMKPRRREFNFPFKGFFLLILGFLFFKGFTLAAIGSATFADRVDILKNGTVVEQGGAWFMQVDPVSQMIAEYLRPIIR